MTSIVALQELKHF